MSARLRMLTNRLEMVESTSDRLAEVCHGDVVTDVQIDALHSAVAAQADAIALMGRLLRELLAERGDA